MADTPAKPLINLTVNGRAITAPPGTLLIEACKQAHIEVPSFCYYPNLSLQAACRMCLVEIEKMPKLQTACTVVVSEGMVVRSETEQVHRARKSAVEFILTNHPLDCPVCDAGGECELQDMTFKYGAEKSRFVEPKRHRDEQQWSPLIYFDRPRCILCYRCVRACGEGMDVWALGVSNRGVNSTIIPNHGDHLECEECGNCVDICPVGALTAGPYRYKTRPWEMTHVGAVCTYCGDGCKTTLGVRNDTILRADNRDKSGINGDFLCVKGRYGVDFTQHPERLKQPLARVGGSAELKPVSWSYALGTIAKRWLEIQKAGGSFGVVGSTRSLNEEAYTLQKFARRVLGTNNIDHHRSADYPALFDALGGREGQPVPLAPAEALKAGGPVLLIGGNPTDEHPLLAWNLRWGYRLNKTRLYILNRGDIKLRRQAYRYARVGDEAAAVRFLNGTGDASAQLTGVGEASEKRWPQTPPSTIETVNESLQEFRARLRQEKDVVIVFGSEISGDAIRELVAFGAGLEGTTRYIAMSDNANSHGAADMGLYPDLLPGYTPISERSKFEALWGGPIPAEPGMDWNQMRAALQQQNLCALYVSGANPFRNTPVAPESLKQTFLVVQDLFLTETAQCADVVLPALSGYEKAGTLTNTCGEVQAQKRGGGFEGAKSDLEILYLLADAMGAEWGAASPDRVLQEIRTAVKGYGVSLAKLLSGESVMAVPLNGRVPHRAAPELLLPNRDTLFTAGTLGRYSVVLNSVMERHLKKEAAAE